MAISPAGPGTKNDCWRVLAAIYRIQPNNGSGPTQLLSIGYWEPYPKLYSKGNASEACNWPLISIIAFTMSMASNATSKKPIRNEPKTVIREFTTI
jgi:hypothetical protein